MKHSTAVDECLALRLRALATHATGRMQSDILAAAALAEAATAPKRAKRSVGAEAFFDALQVARVGVEAAYGDRWAILGYGTWATLPASLRKFTGPRGGTVRLRADMRVPPAEFWPNGEIPTSLVLAAPTPPPGEDVEHPYRVHERLVREAQKRIDLVARARVKHTTALRAARVGYYDCPPAGQFNVTSQKAQWLARAAEIRLELAANLRRLREIGQPTEPVEETDVADDYDMMEAAD